LEIVHFCFTRPSSLDVVVASHILLLLNGPFPDPIISDLLIESFPSLVIHSRLILYRAFPSPSTTPPLRHPGSGISWHSLIPRPKFSLLQETKSEAERHFARMRWGWVGLALISAVSYFWMNPMVILIEVPDGDETEPQEDETGDDVDNNEEDDEEEAEEEIREDYRS